MPRKRHYGKYSKPQSTAPHSLESSGRQSNIHHEEPLSRSVNDILANLRKATIASHVNAAQAASAGGAATTAAGSSAVFPSPSVPPEIAHILLPDLPPTLVGGGGGLPHHQQHRAGAAAGGQTRAGAGAGGNRRRGPAGPAPPPSWLAQSRHAPRRVAAAAASSSSTVHRHRQALLSSSSLSAHTIGLAMAGVNMPDRGSLVDMALRTMAREWQVQKHYNQYYLMHLQGPLRAALIAYLGRWSHDGRGVCIGDLKALLVPPVLPPTEDEEGSDGSGPDLPSPSTLNEDVRYLDLSGAVGQSLSLKELSDLLFPDGASGGPLGKTRGAAKGKDKKLGSTAEADDAGLLESWDLPEGSVALPRHTLPQPLLPNLTHLSLALAGHSDPTAQITASWRHLLALAAHLPRLTHLSLAYWPEPTLTPNAKHVISSSPDQGGTRSLDNRWAEAVLLVRKLSKALYGLEYLDLTGCVAWATALVHRVDSNQVDWAGDWGKITTVVLACGQGDSEYIPGVDEEEEQQQRAAAQSTATAVEQHIRRQRAGQGRFITVEYDRTGRGRS